MDGVEMDDRVKQDEYRRSLTVDDDASLVLFQSLCFTSLSPSSFCPIDCVSDGDKSRMR